MFIDQIQRGIQESGGALCVGLDPHRDRIPARFGSSVDGIRDFIDWIVDETVEHACAYKPNSAFFEVHGAAGWTLLEHVIRRVHAMGRPVILDAKRGDIASTAAAYAEAAFSGLGVDALTLVPYMGEDAITPFLDAGGFAFVLTSPSNASAPQIVDHGSVPLHEVVAELSVALDARFPGQVGLVVGATRPEPVQRLDELGATLPWLVPGLGTQGGRASDFFEQVGCSRLTVVNVSRSILFADRPREAAARMKADIEEARHA